MSSTSQSSILVRDCGFCCSRSSRCLRSAPSTKVQSCQISRIARKPTRPVDVRRQTRARLAWEHEKRKSLRTALIRQYEAEERPKWARNSIRFGQSFDADNDPNEGPRITLKSRKQQNDPSIRESDVQCGIFWDIENVRNDTHPPAIVIEAIRDFAGCSITPVFQAYMSRGSTPLESRTHAIYAQLGVTFIQCYGLGKDTADKKIISDMWKFYATSQKSSPNTRIRIILLTGDRDFADAIGQLRNFGVEVGILTGTVNTTAPVYDDYTLGMRVLPLLGVIEARARDIDLNAYQASKRLSISAFDKYGRCMITSWPSLIIADFVDESRSEVGPRALPEAPASSLRETRSVQAEESHETKVGSRPKVDNVPANPAATETIIDNPEAISEAAGVKEKEQITGTVETVDKQQISSTHEVMPNKPETAAESTEVPAVKRMAHTTNSLEAATQSLPDPEAARDKEEVADSKQSERQDRGGIFGRLKTVLGFSSKKTTDEHPTSKIEAELRPQEPQQPEQPSPTTSISSKPKLKQPELSEANLAWTPPSTSRVTAPEIPLQSSIFSSSLLVPPNMAQLSPTQISTTTTLPPCPVHITSPTDIIAFYTRETLANRPVGISENDMQRLLSAWCNIEGWNGEMKENQIRRAARIALSKAEKLLVVRRELSERKGEGEVVEKESERSVFERVLGRETTVYPLTEELKDSSTEVKATSVQEAEQPVAAEVAEREPPTPSMTVIQKIQKPPQPIPTVETTQSGKETPASPKEKEIYSYQPKAPTPLIQSPIRQPTRIPTPAETLAALSSQSQAAKKAWINNVRSRLGAHIPQPQSKDISNRV